MSAQVSMTVQDYWEIALRRKWLVLGSLVVSLGISWTLCLVLPKSYRSSTLILVENQKIPERYVQGVVSGTVQERLTLIQQQVMSRTLLTKVIEEFKLDAPGGQHQPVEAFIDSIRKDIRVEIKGGGHGRVDAFSISFAHENPVIARNVTTKIASQFIDENLRIREQFVEGASEFLDHELASSKAELERQEQAMSEYKQKNMGQLPGQLDANLRSLDRLQSESITIQDSLPTLNERVGLLEKAINEYRTRGITTSSLNGGHEQRTTDPLLTRLRELEHTLVSLSAEYKDTYPDVIRTKQEIEQVKAQLAERHELPQQDKGKANRGERSIARRAYDPYLESLVKQRDDIVLEMKTLKERHRRVTAQMKMYEDRVEQAPGREQELMLLVRDYDNLQRNYQSLLDKRINARVAENLEKRQKGEQFRVLDPANLPGTPEKPDRLRIMLVGLALGCGVGYGGAFALERVNASFRRPEDAEATLGYPVLAEIPSFNYAYDKPARRLLPSTSLAVGAGGTRLIEDSRASKGGMAGWGGSSRREQAPSKWGASASTMPPERNLVSKWNPTSVVAEQFRVAATRLALMGVDRTSTVIVVTSAVKGEGKSSTLLNLGYVLAQDMEKSTLIIDGDLKQPVMHTYSGVPRTPGLADVLHGVQPLDRCLRQLGDSSLWLVPAGSVGSRHVDLGKMKRLTAIVRELRSRFEYILVDAPPILPLADMNVLAGLADVLVLVVRAGATGRDVVQKALKKLKPTTDAGIILTDSWVDSMPYYLRGYGYVQAGKGRAS